MSRARRLTYVFALLLSCAYLAPAWAEEKKETVAVTPAAPKLGDWQDPAYVPTYAHYFKYQNYLTMIGLAGETKDTWAKLKTEEKLKKASEGEAWLQKRLEELLQQPHLSGEDEAMLRAVWGSAAAKSVKNVALARRSQDPVQIELALKSAKSLVGKAADNVDWNALFDGTKPEAEGPTDPAKNPLAVTPKVDFLTSLASPDTQKILANRKTYGDFLKKHNVAPQAITPLLAMYDVIANAGPTEKKELSHILPTVVQFLKDGKPIVVQPMDGAFGFAEDDELGQPKKVAVTPPAADADPVVVADVLTHEFQHIYDMYTGRYYSLDSELRGFKTNVTFYRALKDSNLTQNKTKLAAMFESDDTATRRYAQNWLTLDQRYKNGPRDFADKIAFGHGYNHYSEGVFSGRLPLREAADPVLGAEREVVGKQKERDEAKSQTLRLEAELQALTAKNSPSSITSDKQIAKVASDLAAARARFSFLDNDLVTRQRKLKRMRLEVAWLDKKSLGKKDADPYDLHLQVDKDYVLP